MQPKPSRPTGVTILGVLAILGGIGGLIGGFVLIGLGILLGTLISAEIANAVTTAGYPGLAGLGVGLVATVVLLLGVIILLLGIPNEAACQSFLWKRSTHGTGDGFRDDDSVDNGPFGGVRPDWLNNGALFQLWNKRSAWNNEVSCLRCNPLGLPTKLNSLFFVCSSEQAPLFPMAFVP